MGISVCLSKALEEKLILEGNSPTEFSKEFKLWKSGDEYDHIFFGKDGAYFKPTLDIKNHALMHVHLVPLNDLVKLRKWERDFSNRSRKTSNRVLVYVTNNKGGFLLIYILDEPDAHEIALMKTEMHKEIMNGFSEMANAFIWDGTILDRT